MLLAGFLARQGKFLEALEEIHRYGGNCDPNEVAQVVTQMVVRPGNAPDQLRKLESVVTALSDTKGGPSPLLVALAEIQLALDHSEEAEQLYRRVLSRDPADVNTANNLSVLLALQQTHLDEAAAMIQQVIQKVGPVGAFLDTRAVVAIAQHDYKRAEDDLEAALAEKSTPTRLFHRAWAFLEEGNPQMARESLQAAKNAGLNPATLASAERKIYEKIDRLGQ